MKGKSMKPKQDSPSNEILKYFAKKAKPWVKDTAKTYTWKSSIPEKWICLKGEEFFKHVSEVKQPRLSVEILQNAPKYVHHFRVASQELSQRSSTSRLDAKAPEVQPREFERRFSLPINRDSPERKMTLGESVSIIAGASRPNTGKDLRSSCYSLMPFNNNRNIEEFLDRFEKKPSIKEQPLANKGLLGWKLKHLRENEIRRKKSNYCQIFNVKKTTDKVFAVLAGKNLHMSV